MLLFPLLAAAQGVSVTGTVHDAASGLPIVGVTIVEAGNTSVGTVSDTEGRFTLQGVSSLNATLSVSSIGYRSVQVPLNGATHINIELSEDAELIEDVVVVGYGVQRRSDVTGAIATVDDRMLKEVAGANMTQALQGRVAGITISQNSTRPGQSGQIRIRGARSLSASNDPLIVLDGIPFEGSMNDINPGDIKSINILKDASATAIYGARGANGVILITTYRGTPGKARVTYNGSFGIKEVAQRYEVFNAEEFIRLRQLAGAYSNLPQEDAMIAAGKETDWQDLMYQSGRTTQHDMSISGGNDYGQYSMGMGFYNETTVLPGQDFTRYSLRASIDQEITKWLSIGMSSNNSYGVTNGESASPLYSMLALSPISPAYNDDGSLFEQPNNPNLPNFNPLTIKNTDSWAERRKRFSSFNSLYAELRFTPWLKYRANIGLSYRQDNYGNFQAARTALNGGEASSAAVENGLATTWTIENLLYFDKVFADKHHVSATAMYSTQQNESNTSRMQATDIIADYMQYYNLGNYKGNIDIPADRQRYTKTSLLSYMGRVNYSYDDRYVATFTIRHDGSSVLAKGNQWHTYPAASVAWNISNEEFAQQFKWLGMLKLRAGFGQTANQAVGAYSTLGSLAQNAYNFGEQNVFGYYVNVLGNRDLGWEYTNTFNVGLDFYVLGDRLSGTIDWYYQETHDLLLNQGLPPSSGVTGSMTKNIGSTKNTGMEFSLSGDIVRGRDFQWTLDANVAFNQNEILSLTSGTLKDDSRGWFVGEPIDVIFDYEKIGIWQIEEAAEAAKFGARPGEVKILDWDKNGSITTEDRHILGQFAPKIEGGFTSRMNWKNLDLTIVGFWRAGNTLVSTLHQAGSYIVTHDGRRNQLKVDYWTPTNPTNFFPAPHPGGQPTTNGNYGGVLGYFDGGFLKIRSMTLGYNVPDNFMKKIGMGSARLYFSVLNPFTLFSEYVNKYGGVDPEATGSGTQSSGGTFGGIQGRHLTIGMNTPPTRTYMLGLNVNF